LRRQLHILSSRLFEFEHGQRESLFQGPSPEPSEVPAGAATTSRADGPAVRQRKSPSMRRSGFSAVISNKGVSPVASVSSEVSEGTVASEAEGTASPAESPQMSSEEPQRAVRDGGEVRETQDIELREDVLEHVLSEGSPEGELKETATWPEAAQPEPRSESRKIIGARRWEEDSRGGQTADDEEELANTQIIPKMQDDETPAVSLPGITPKAGRAPSRTSSSPERPKVAPEKPGGQPGDERDLLSELKAVINKKFDELMK
jgi:hypothetical protein